MVNEPNILRWNVSWKNEIALTENYYITAGTKVPAFLLFKYFYYP
nr:MAG TPA: hypothetical protein [Caudoviricetes sp.]